MTDKDNTNTVPAWTAPTRGLPWDVLTLQTLPQPTLPPPLPLPKAVPEPEEWLLVRVSYAGLNPGAIFQMTLLPASLRASPAVQEMDFGGTVADVWAPSQGRFSKGDRVAGMIPANFAVPTGTGALMEIIRVPARYVVHLPPNVKMSEGCALLPGLTARQMILESGVKSGDRVLVNAAAGGIGSMLLQMARTVVGSEGYVVGICSGAKRELVRGLGADDVVDYTATNVQEHLSSHYGSTLFDVVLDARGHQELYLASPAFLRPAGIYSSVGIKPPSFFVPDFLRAVWTMKMNEWWPTSTWLGGVGRRWAGTSMMSPTLEEREAVVDMLGRGEVRVVVDSIWAFEEAKEAYRRLGAGHAGGRVVVRVDPLAGDE